MFLNILFAVTMYPVLLIMYFALRNEYKNHPPYLCGVTIPPFLQKDEVVLKICDGYQRQIKVLTLLMALMPIPVIFIPYFSISFSILMLWTLLVCTLYFVPFGIAHRKLGLFLQDYLKKNPQDTETATSAATDRYWIFGMFYYNKSDRKNTSTTRFGNGSSINLARPLGKFLAGFILLSLLSIPAVSIFCILEEFVPIQLTIQDNTLTATQLNTDYAIPLSAIEDPVLITELPRLTKSTGSSMDTLCKGKFWSRETGHCQVFLNPENSYFINFTADGTIYFFSGSTDEETQNIYQELLE